MRLKKFIFLAVCGVFLISFAVILNAQSIDTEFTLYEGEGCTENGYIWVEANGEGIIERHETLYEDEWCLEGEDENCCPVQYECADSDEDGSFICELMGFPFSILSCEDYKSSNLNPYNDWADGVEYPFYEFPTTEYRNEAEALEAFCRDNPLNVENTIGDFGTVHVEGEQYIVTDGRCSWKDGGCITLSTTSEHIGIALFTCEKIFTKEDLPGNRINYRWEATPEWMDEALDNIAEICGSTPVPDCQQAKLEAAGCVSGSKLIKYNVARLGFFGLVSFVVSVLLIITLYFAKLKQTKDKI